MKIVCVSCGKQAIDAEVPENACYVTTIIGARAAFRRDECFCGHCAAEMNEDGLFPEEVEQDPIPNARTNGD